jgi:uncharacterized protein YmfQ (DUF2313 family)
MGMTMSERSVRLALPRGIVWLLGGDGSALIAGISKSIERLRVAAFSVVDESRPGTATVMLKEWHEILGQPYDETLPVATQRARLEAFLTSAGGATRPKLQAQIDLEFSGITISEIKASSEASEDECGVAFCNGTDADISPDYYDVSGTLDTDKDADRLACILARFAPKHLISSSSLTVLSATGNAECGLSICGIEECGNDGT